MVSAGGRSGVSDRGPRRQCVPPARRPRGLSRGLRAPSLHRIAECMHWDRFAGKGPRINSERSAASVDLNDVFRPSARVAQDVATGGLASLGDFTPMDKQPGKGARFMSALNTAVNTYVLARVAWSLLEQPVRAAWRWLLGLAE